jgi:hypothetical protein
VGFSNTLPTLAEAFEHKHNFLFRMPDLAAAARLAETHTLPSARPRSTWSRATGPLPWRLVDNYPAAVRPAEALNFAPT